ncbi:MAG: hypothetical protein ACQETA_06740 [Bacteroidota bacterium]
MSAVNKSSIAWCLLLLSSVSSGQGLTIDQKVDSLLALMTLDEKGGTLRSWLKNSGPFLLASIALSFCPGPA